MVDGVLYMWPATRATARLAWSTDHGGPGRGPTGSSTTSFGCPTFLNFGKNYAGARDDYVYVYSHDSESAYQAADRMVLARVPRAGSRTGRAYEFFRGRDERDGPWTGDITGRGAVFSHQGMLPIGGQLRCGTEAILGARSARRGSPIPGRVRDLRRPRALGAMDDGVLHRGLDVGPGESSSFPTKWMSRRQDNPPRLLGRRLLLRPQVSAGNEGGPMMP